MRSLSSILSVAAECGRALLHLAYPPICLHCEAPTDDKSALFCPQCSPLLELIDPQERCPLCFSAEYCRERRRCPQCAERPPLLNRSAAAFDYLGPAADLIRGMKYGNQPYLAKGAAAFLAAQLFALDWPLPDAIVPVPMAFTKRLQRGYNQSALLAEHLSGVIGRPVCTALRRRSGDFSQAGLTRDQRMALQGDTFYLSKNVALGDQCLLLVDDVMTTGSTMRCCAETLFEGYPSGVYGLTVCAAIQ